MLAGGVSHRNGKTSITEAWKAGTIGLMNRGYCKSWGIVSARWASETP
jgi:hypothetical protein